MSPQGGLRAAPGVDDRPGGRLQWTYERPSTDLGCTSGQTIVTRDEVVEPGVIFQNFVGGTCDLGAGHTVMVLLSPK